MFSNFFEQIMGFKDTLPNKFSITLGELIRKARVEQKMSQTELAKKSYFSQTAISQIEQGKRDVSASEIVYFSYALNKPILYFYSFLPNIKIDNHDGLSILEEELLMQSKKMSNEDLKRTIAQMKALVDFTEGE